MWKSWILRLLSDFLSVASFPRQTRTNPLKPNRNSQNRTIFHQTEHAKYSFSDFFAGFSTSFSLRFNIFSHKVFHKI